MKPFADSSPTVKLATARLEFTRDRRAKQALRMAAIVAVAVLTVVLARPLYMDATGLATLQQHNAALRGDLARVRMELELERSTRISLEHQVTELNRETTELKSRLDFFNAQSGRGDTATR
jgi:hypothetical protein